MISGVACRVSETNKMSTSDSCKDSASKSNDDGVCEVIASGLITGDSAFTNQREFKVH